MIDNLISQLQRNMVACGFREGTEQYEVCQAALKFLGLPYQQSEELLSTHTDCSTLVSQAHWLGACIRIPFTAQSQRDAIFGAIDVLDSQPQPGDVVVKFNSTSESRDKKHNHVGLYLGHDASGVKWVIESEQGYLVRLKPFFKFNPKGGVRRFIFSRKRFHSPQSQVALSLAPRVPKLGRLGANQHTISKGIRRIHRGVDIYLPVGTPVYAATTGFASCVREASSEHCEGIEISTNEYRVRYFMLSDIPAGLQNRRVEVGQLIGYVNLPHHQSSIIYSESFEEKSHLHWEVEMLQRTDTWTIDGKSYIDPLYMTKIGRFAMPLSTQDLNPIIQRAYA